jgi:hypothetical protein
MLQSSLLSGYKKQNPRPMLLITALAPKPSHQTVTFAIPRAQPPRASYVQLMAPKKANQVGLAWH